jgi:hypothetical protein
MYRSPPLTPTTRIGIRSVICTQPGLNHPPDTRVGGKSQHLPSFDSLYNNYPQLPQPATMLERPEFPRSNRTLSASSLKDRLSKLSVTPLRPVAALQARVECVHSILSLFGYLAFSALNPYFPSMPPALSLRVFLGSADSRPSRSHYGPTWFPFASFSPSSSCTFFPPRV